MYNSRNDREQDQLPDESRKNIRTESIPDNPFFLTVVIVSLLVYWSINCLWPGSLSIIPGAPLADTLIVGAIVGVFLSLHRLKNKQTADIAREIQENIAASEAAEEEISRNSRSSGV